MKFNLPSSLHLLHLFFYWEILHLIARDIGRNLLCAVLHELLPRSSAETGIPQLITYNIILHLLWEEATFAEGYLNVRSHHRETRGGARGERIAEGVVQILNDLGRGNQKGIKVSK